MSASREKKMRRIVKANYFVRLECWQAKEPPKWRFIAWLKWKNSKPKRTW